MTYFGTDTKAEVGAKERSTASTTTSPRPKRTFTRSKPCASGAPSGQSECLLHGGRLKEDASFPYLWVRTFTKSDKCRSVEALDLLLPKS